MAKPVFALKNGKTSVFFLFLLTNAFLFSVGGFTLNVGSHAAGAKTPFGIGKGESRAKSAVVRTENALATVALFHYRAAVSLGVIDGRAVHDDHLVNFSGR